jgi:peptidoglycan/LPS O-acetylase OafA/YrhL
MTWSYRPALDGLRTLAVYLVVLFHAGVAWMTGGFIGVDLFFVLSGFLVSTILLEELERTGRIDLLHFYDRRIRRLLPAAVLLVVSASGVALVVLSAVRRDSLVGDAQAALLYVANWRFLAQKNDYFGATDVEGSLFLHFWSLSIEEQFYFFFPLLLVVLWRVGGRRRAVLVGAVAGVCAGSVAAQLFWAGLDPNHAYYGTETRLYQLLSGSLLALAARRVRGPRPPRGAVTALAVLSLAGMIATATWAGLSASHRGLLATVFSVGLVASLAGTSEGPMTRVFSLPPLVYLGKISYGTYLWHWPVIVLLAELVRPPELLRTLIVTATSTAFAAASYHMLERPIRSRRVPDRLRLAVVASGLATSVAVALVVVPPVLQQARRPDLVAAPGARVAGTEANAEGRIPDIDFISFRRDKGPDQRHCSSDEMDRCAVVTGQPGPRVVLVGDSHGQMLGRALRMLAEEHGFNLWVSTVSGCPWQLGLVKAANVDKRQSTCAQARRDLYERGLRAVDADLVVLTQRARDVVDRANLVRPPGDDRAVASRDALVVETTERTFAAIGEAGARTLVVQGVWALADSAPPPLECLATARRVQQCRIPVEPGTGILDAVYVATAAVDPDVFTVDINPIMCPAAPVCDPVLDGVPVWRDGSHYSPAVIVRKRDQVWQAMQDSGAFDGVG